MAESMVAPADVGMAGDATQDSETTVSKRDFDRLRAKLDKQNGELRKQLRSAQDQASRANQARADAETQVNTILSQAEEAMMKGMSEDQKREYELRRVRRDNQRLTQEQLRSTKQIRMDEWRNGILGKYGLRGNEDGLDYSSPERFLETAIATRAALVLRDRMNAVGQNRTHPDAEQARKVANATKAEASEETSAEVVRQKPPRLETRSPTSIATPSGTLDAEVLKDLQWQMTKGPIAQRNEARKKLVTMRAGVS